MNIAKEDFDRAARRVSLPDAQAQELWNLLQARRAPETPVAPRRFDVANVAYYLGALIIIGALGWFMSTAWEVFGGAGICLIGVTYVVGFAAVGVLLWKQAVGGLRNLGGLLVTVAVAIVPLVVYGVERWGHWWPAADPGSYAGFHEWVRGGWIWMEISTVLAGSLALAFVRFPFLTAPIALVLWYMSMDLTPVLFASRNSTYTYQQYLWVSLGFGVCMLLAAYILDVLRRWQGPDYGFWLSFFGLLAFWISLHILQGEGESRAVFYALINLALIFLGVILDRRIGVIFGAIGLNIYIGHLAWDIFAKSVLFPFVLTGFGVFIIVCGVVYARNCAAWRAAIVRALPPAFDSLVPATARAGR